MVIETDARTLENSEVGDITKLSLVLDQEMRCWMLLSSSILRQKLVTGDTTTLGPESAVLVKLMNESSLYHFRLLGCSSSPNRWVWGITGVPDLSTVGTHCAPVAVGATVDSHPRRGRGGRGDLHFGGMMNGGRKDRDVSCFARSICRPERISGGWIGETTHVEN